MSFYRKYSIVRVHPETRSRCSLFKLAAISRDRWRGLPTACLPGHLADITQLASMQDGKSILNLASPGKLLKGPRVSAYRGLVTTWPKFCIFPLSATAAVFSGGAG
ncbi:hypothetical protein N7453_009957, partial [Penicillium expansum]